MSVRFEWNPNAESDLKRDVVRNLTPRFQATLTKVTCPDHGEHPTIEVHSEEWRIRACCERAAEMARAALGEVLR
jgi:hypothetical protein